MEERQKLLEGGWTTLQYCLGNDYDHSRNYASFRPSLFGKRKEIKENIRRKTNIFMVMFHVKLVFF